MANISISLEGIDQALANLNYKTGSSKHKAVMAIRSFYGSEESIKNMNSIDMDHLIPSIWDTGDDISKIKAKRRNFSSIRSSINADLEALSKKSLNLENITISEFNIFDMTEEAKNNLLSSFTDAVKTGDIDLHQATNLLKAVTDFLDNIQIDKNETDSSDIVSQIKKILNTITKDILSDENLNTQKGPQKLKIGGFGLGDKKEGQELLQPPQGIEDEILEEIEETDEIEDLEDDEIEVLEETDDVQTIELDEDEDVQEVEEIEDSEQAEEIEDIDEIQDMEEIVDIDEDIQDIESIDLDEDEELIESIEPDEELPLEEIEIDEDEQIDEIEEDQTIDETLEEDIETLELDEDEELIESIEPDEELPLEEIGDIDDGLEIELEEDEEIQEADESENNDTVIDSPDLDEAIDLVELEEDNDIEEIQIDEDDLIDEVEDADEVEPIVEDGESIKESIPKEDIDELNEDEIKALEDYRRRKELAEHFDEVLGDREKKFNAYTIIPKGKYTVGTKKGLKSSLELQQIDMPKVYMGIYPVTNALFEIFIEQTGYVTTAEQKGFGRVFRSRFKKNNNGSLWIKSAESEDVKGAAWFHPSGPGSTLHGKRNHPVVQVSIEDALAFASWIGRRLPSEAEWEAAARTDLGYIYPWGDDFRIDALNIEQSGHSDTCTVDQYDGFANEFKLVDMLGNVMEWTSDMEASPIPSQKNMTYCIAKGAAWNSKNDVTISSRGLFKPGFASNTIGFRCISEIYL